MVARRLAYFITCLGLWLILTLTFYIPSVILGIVLAFVVTLIFGKYFNYQPFKLLHPRRFFWLVVYIPVFAWYCLKANLDVAYRVIHPEKPLKPGIVKIKTKLKTDLARTLLANSITMTPGTMSVDICGEVLYIHWIWVRDTDLEKATRDIAGPFEKYLMRIFE
ncbi:MAG: Na+/H+ antiporter subunit E [candidate division WOR-3 bacterium]|nr:Na+/H+ antiporter subunit E [candidate division WOR-3 bacterium]MDW7987398.1 Na+/H+ antiporter subunit E [candidate division WOR-3 bacterium]